MSVLYIYELIYQRNTAMSIYDLYGDFWAIIDIHCTLYSVFCKVYNDIVQCKEYLLYIVYVIVHIVHNYLRLIVITSVYTDNTRL